MAIDLYLKYFHSGKRLNKMMDEIEIENKINEEGLSDSLHIDNLHLDNKEEGGTDKIITIGFTKLSYKNAKKKNRRYNTLMKIKQDKYSNTGNAWKVWDSSLVLARWVYANEEIFKNKSVHEVGSGCGLVGLISSLYSEKTTLSDYKDEILQNLQINVNLNFQDCLEQKTKIFIKNLDFEKVYNGQMTINEEEKVDIVLGADVVYGFHLSLWLPSVLDNLIKPNGAFYGIMPKNRVGLDEFIINMESYSFVCDVFTVPEEFCEDFVKKSCWNFFLCKRNATTNQIHLLGNQFTSKNIQSQTETDPLDFLCGLN